VAVPAGAEVTVPVTLTIPLNTPAADYTFAFVAVNGSGGSDQAAATLTVTPPLAEIAVSPELQRVPYGETVAYTLTLSNMQPPADNYNPPPATCRYDLAVEGLEAHAVDIPPELAVKPGETVEATMQVTAQAPQAFAPFQVTARCEREEAEPIIVSDGAALTVNQTPGVQGTLSPSVASAAPGTPASFALEVTNTGEMADSYDLTVQPPAGWSAEVLANAVPRTRLDLPPAVFNTALLDVQVTPPDNTPDGTYPFSILVTSRTYPSIQAVITAQVEVGRGVVVAITPEEVTMEPEASQSWDVQVTNAGNHADTFDLSVGGVIAGNARFSSDSVALGAGESTTIQMTTEGFSAALPSSYPFGVTAQSQSKPVVTGSDTARITFTGVHAVAVDVDPVTRTVELTEAMTLRHLVVITNTGNVNHTYRLTAGANSPDWTVKLEADEVYIPAHMTAALLLTMDYVGQAVGSQPSLTANDSEYTLVSVTVEAHSTTGGATDDGTAMVNVGVTPYQYQSRLYLPVVVN
jgi:hypothetical protein